jgi:glycosyltransferase involved in cell wall biosynthesis
MPVYNEEGVVESVVQEWLALLDSMDVHYRLQCWNDGSTDDTLKRLQGFQHPCLEVRSHPNCGHGPTLLRAYQDAMPRADWVFQTDSDGELPAAAFPAFWQARTKADLVIGTRTQREAPLVRRLMTAGSRILLQFLFGGGIQDTNCPYRLMRSTAFLPAVQQLETDIFAPNVLLSGYSTCNRFRILERPVAFTPRTTGTGSLHPSKLAGIAWRCLWQTLRFRLCASTGGTVKD